MNAGILVLLGVTAGVLACFARFFVALARRARQAGAFADAGERDPLYARNGGA